MTSSDELREKGNAIYTTALNPALSPCIRESRLCSAMKLYQMAINDANNGNQYSSAYKNHATTCIELFK